MRLKLLVAVHIAIGTSPVAMFLIPLHVRFSPLVGILASVSYAQLMLLSFWAGMGTSTANRRLLGTLLGIAYLAMWPTISGALSEYVEEPPPTVIFLVIFLASLMIAVLFAGIFLAIRRWKAELCHFPDPAALPPPTRFQYSLLHLLVVTCVATVILGLTRSLRSASDDSTVWDYVLDAGFMIIICLINLLCAGWAALSVGRVGLRVFLVFLIATMLGISQSFAASIDQVSWWQFWSFVLVSVVPTAIVVVSLLIVRSCGYRLVSKALAEPDPSSVKL